MEKIVEVENLILSFHGPAGKVEAVKGVSLWAATGEILALVGESGCGKTALCRSILMLHSSHAEIEGGKILLCGREVTQCTEKELTDIRGRDAAVVFQDPSASLNPVYSIGSQIMEPMIFHERISKKEAWKRAEELLRQVGIDDPEKRMSQYPHQFSGGMRQRVAIAIALACNPKLVIADEPTTALDRQTQEVVMGLLQKICKEQNKALIFVTHDLRLVQHVADRIAVMKDGRVVETGSTEEVFSNPSHDYTKKLLHFAKYGQPGSHFHGKADQQKNAENDKAQAEAPLLSVKSLTKTYSLGRDRVNAVLKDFCLDIYQGEILGLVGKSGCGKSTLARCLMGIHAADWGEILWKRPCRKQMIFQDSASALNPRMTLGRIIAEPMVISRSYGSKDQLMDRVFEMMDTVELPRQLAERHPYDVSGGQRQRAAIARALITDPDFIIADEPVSSLDVTVQAQIIHLLKRIRDQRELTILLISHDLPMVEHVSDRIICLTGKDESHQGQSFVY